jgi:DNA repair protein RecN (Recombination protein N)
MLQTLTIRNLALLESVSLDFEDGFTAVTGETGAGKSVLLGALSLLAGQRSDKSVIRQGADRCEVEAALWFEDSTNIDGLLETLDLPTCEEGLLILKRSLARTRAPKISVNGSMTTLTALQRLGETWIDFHGPSEPRRLLNSTCQMELLDLFAQNDQSLAAYQADYEAWRDTAAERERLATQEKLSPDQISFLRDQLTQLDELDLTLESIEELERDFNRVSQAQELLGLAGELESGLNGDDGVGTQLAPLTRAAESLAELDADSQSLADRIQALGIEVSELARDYAGLGADLHFEPEEVELLHVRMNAWLEAKRKYGNDPLVVEQAREALRNQLDAQGDIEGALARQDKRVAEAHVVAAKKAAALTKQRKVAAKKLAKVAADSIAQIGFKKADFVIGLEPLAELGPAGDCQVEFQFSPNVGEAVRPLHKIASSGELARVMLALKTVLAELDAVPVLVFDEVDANVGGEIGGIVGQKMAEIGQNHQVLCVTHLPQVAAQGNAHFVVEKDQSRDRAEVTIRSIHGDREHRVDELARMLGDRKAASARTHAGELLGSA